MTTLKPAEGDRLEALEEPALPPETVEVDDAPAVEATADGAEAEGTPSEKMAPTIVQPALVVEPPFEPPPPPDRTRFRPPEPTDAPPGVAEDVSSYLHYLPGIYHNNHFLGRFLLIFESILGPLDRTVENMHHYFDPFVTPPEAVDWLGTWVGLALDERWPEDRRRELIAEAVNLYQWRGTKRGLSEFLRLYTGVVPEIIEPTLREIANARGRAYRFTVRITIPAGSRISRSLIETIIDAEKPAFAACTLELIEG
ncbi:MAG: phage tail protein [Tepidiformaceae bacterium]